MTLRSVVKTAESTSLIVDPKYERDEGGQEFVAGAVASPIGSVFTFVLKQSSDHQPDARRIVRRVSIYQYVDVCFYVGEHSAHDEAFASVRLQKHDCAGGAGDRSGIVR